MPAVILVQEGDEEARPALSITLEEGYGAAATVVQNRETPGFQMTRETPGIVPKKSKDARTRWGWQPDRGVGSARRNSGKHHSCEAGKQMVIVQIPPFFKGEVPTGEPNGG